MSTGTNAVKNLSSIFRSKLTFAYELADSSISRHKGKLIELLKEKAEKASQSEIAHKMRVAKGFYKLEMAPPSGDEMQQLRGDLVLAKEFFKTGCYKYLTVKQAWQLFLVATEVYLWFYLGETIGKFHIVGYQV